MKSCRRWLLRSYSNNNNNIRRKYSLSIDSTRLNDKRNGHVYQSTLSELESVVNDSRMNQKSRDLAMIVHQNLLEIYQQQLHNNNNNTNQNENTIQSFLFDFRGLFLTVRYSIETLKSNQNISDDDDVHRLTILKVLSHMGTILMADRVKSNNGNYPFSDSLNIYDYDELKQMEVEHYFSDIGTQYAPMVRILLGMMVSVTASHHNAQQYSPVFRNSIFYASTLYYYIFNSRQGAKEATKFMQNLTVDSGKGLWTMVDTNPTIKRFTFLTLPPIELSATFHIPFHTTTSTTTSTTTVMDSVAQLDFYLKKIPHAIAKRKQQQLKSHVQMRVISSKRLNISKDVTLVHDYPYLGPLIQSVRGYGSRLFGDSQSMMNGEKNENGIIFHIHGGGYIAMSSFSHESYLRPWATQTGMPIFSVDYSKTPDEQYPVQIEECYQAYKWLLSNAEKEFGVKMNKIIFAGDSAGGNLILSVLIRIIHEGELRIPDGLVLTYPATYLQFSPSPARILSLLDPLLNFKLMELCGMQYYLSHNSTEDGDNNHDAMRNALISPCIAPDEIIRKFPRTYISAGSLDPLFDDSVYLAKRIEELNGCENIHFQVYDTLGHGFLHLIHAYIPEGVKATNNICEWINSLGWKKPG